MINRQSPASSFSFAVALFVAAVLPWQIAFYAVPIVSYATEAAAFVGWSLLLLVLGKYLAMKLPNRAVAGVLCAIALLAATASAQLLVGKILWPSQLVQMLYFLAVAALVTWTAAQIQSLATRNQIIDAWAWCWLVGCVLSAVAALVQYLQWEVSWYIVAPLADAGRIYGNVHQSNQFATLMAMGLPGVVWLNQRNKLSMRAAAVCAVVIAVVVVMSSSRTGLIQLLWLAAWMTLPHTGKRRLAAPLLLAAVAAYGLFYALNQAGIFTYFNSSRLPTMIDAEMGITDSRLSLWRETLTLIAQNPWAGVGFGQFEFYRTFSDVPNALKIIHVNAHMLPLQIAVEYGLPVAALFFALAIYAVLKAGAAWRDPGGNFAMAGIGVVLIHSMTEFPLWYAFILLPFAFLCGIYLSSTELHTEPAPGRPQKLTGWRRMHMYGALSVLGGIALGITHYLPTVAMYVLNSKDITRDERLATSEKAFLYKNWIVYNSIGGTSFEEITKHPELITLFDKTSRFYMNEFNMAQYALVLAENGRHEQATRVVASLRRQASKNLSDLRAYCQTASSAGAKRLLEVIDSQEAPQLSAKDF